MYVYICIYSYSLFLSYVTLKFINICDLKKNINFLLYSLVCVCVFIIIIIDFKIQRICLLLLKN